MEYKVRDAEEISVVEANQQEPGRQCVDLGVYALAVGGHVEVRGLSDGAVMADAVRLQWVGN